eukprot:1153154-Pelagomonas_calceolata.AAC.4
MHTYTHIHTHAQELLLDALQPLVLWMHGDEVGQGGLLQEFWAAAHARVAPERRWVLPLVLWLHGDELVQDGLSMNLRVAKWSVGVAGLGLCNVSGNL